MTTASHHPPHLKINYFQLVNINISSGSLLDATLACVCSYSENRASTSTSECRELGCCQTSTFPHPSQLSCTLWLISGDLRCQHSYLDQRCCLSCFQKTAMEEIQDSEEERKRGKALKARNKQQSGCITGELEKALTGFNSRLF